jgi:hypothetical protein
MKRYDKDQQETLREFPQGTADRAVVWIDDGTGRILDELEVETRIRPGTEGCQLCHEPLDGREAHGEVQIDDWTEGKRTAKSRSTSTAFLGFSSVPRRDLHRLHRVGPLAPSLRRT